jgi:hypothetical protein
MKYQVRDNQIQFDNGKSIALAFAVGDTLEVDGVLVVVLKLPPGQSMTENVFGISENGVVLWQIDRIAETSIDPISNQYAGIIGHDEEKGTVRVSNWNGVVVDVDINNGKVKHWYWGK